MNLHELVRRLQAGETRNAISRTMRLSVNTVSAYRRWAEAQNLLTGPLPDLATLERLRLATRWYDAAAVWPGKFRPCSRACIWWGPSTTSAPTIVVCASAVADVPIAPVIAGMNGRQPWSLA